MIYLTDFIIPRDSWVDSYFSPVPVSGIPKNMPRAPQNTHINSWYPWHIFYNRGMCEFSFEDITIFYGGNGSGKTTLLNVIAQRLRVQRLSRYNRSVCFDDYISVCNYSLADSDSERCVQRGSILVSDDVFDSILKKREENERIDHRRDELIDDYYAYKYTTELPRENLTDPQTLELYKNIHNARSGRKSCSQFVKANLNRNLKEQSNGETAFEFFVQSIKDDSLVLLDEPENSLSAKWQMELVRYIIGAVRAFRCQFVIATHSPFLLSIPGAKIYDLDQMPIKTEQWYNLENVRCYYQLFEDNKHLFK